MLHANKLRCGKKQIKKKVPILGHAAFKNKTCAHLDFNCEGNILSLLYYWQSKFELMIKMGDWFVIKVV